MFSTLQSEIRELRQKDTVGERKREQYEWAIEKEKLLHKEAEREREPES